MHRTKRILGWLTACSLILSSSLAQTRKERGRPFLLGGPQPTQKREIRLDPRLPRGALRLFSTRPDASQRACSFKRPVCVHGAPSVSPERLLTALEAMETAYSRVVIALGIPAPLADGDRGGSDALDLYLHDATNPAFSVEADLQRFGAFDSGSAFCRSGASSRPALLRAATQCLGEAIGHRLDLGAAPHTQRAFATHLWWATGKPTALDAEAIDDFQQHPELAPLRRELGAISEGAAAWFELVEATRGRSAATRLSQGLVSLAASETDASSLFWNNEPDVFDVVRRTLDEDPFAIAGFMNDWAVQRAFVGTRDDGSQVPSLAWAGDFGRIRFDWLLRYSELPRRVLATRPIEPTGSIYLLLELDDVALGATLGFQAEWEAPVSFVWSLVQIDKQGHEMSRMQIPFKESARSTEQRLQNFEGAAFIVLVGTNIGGVDRDHPFDPDVAPYEPHLCTVYLVRL